MIVVIPIIVSLVIGVLTRGSLSNLATARFRYLPVLVLSLVVQLLIFTPVLGTHEIIHEFGPYIYIGTVIAALLAILANLRIPGMKIVALGAGLNALVIIANGGFMPSPEAALETSGGIHLVTEDAEEKASGKQILTNSTLMNDDTNLRYLGDVFAIPDQLPFANVVSIGDILISLGGSIAVLRLMHRRRDEPFRSGDTQAFEAVRHDTPIASEPMC